VPVGSNLGASGYVFGMKTKDVGMAGLRGWRGTVANVVAAPVAKRSSLREDQVRAAVGVAFLVLSLVYLIGALREVLGDDR
jgi:hypothetical protein